MHYRIVVPNGLIANLYGRRHDARMLRHSGLLRSLELHGHSRDGARLCLYGDLAYSFPQQLMAAYRIGEVRVLTEDMKAFRQ